MVYQKLYPLLLAVIVGLAIYLPNVWQSMDDRYKGVPVSLNTDEHAYLIHLQETLEGRFGQAGKGIIEAYRDEQSFIFMPIEEIYGLLFHRFDITAAELFSYMDFVMPFLVVLVMFAATRALGFSRRDALVITALFCAFESYHLGRPVNQRVSFLLTLLTIWSFACALRGSRKAQWTAGLTMGFLVGVYLWGWLAVWCVGGLIGVLLIVAALHNGDWVYVYRYACIGLWGAVCASPFIYHILSIQKHPIYEQAMERSGVRVWHLPESWPWSLCTLAIAVCTTALWYRRGMKREEIGITAIALSTFILLNQHMIHGTEILFRNHYLMWIGWGALLTGFYLWRQSNQERGIQFSIFNFQFSTVGLIAAMLIVGALFTENRYYFNQWKRTEGKFEEQHLASALPILRQLDTTTMLSDSYTTGFLLSHTKHYGVYSEYLFQSYLIPHSELAERYCTSEYPLDADAKRDPRIINWNIQLDATIRQEFLDRQNQLVWDACDRVQDDMPQRLVDYDVEFLFWDEKRQPGWDVNAYGVELELYQHGEGWSLWRIQSERQKS